MEFRLTFDGALKPTTQSKPRYRHKHEIRRHFHPQLKCLWQDHPALRGRKTAGADLDQLESWIDARARRFVVGETRFVPLVTADMQVTCGIDMVYLRPKGRAAILDAGDIDRRLKTVFDALAMPTDVAQLGGSPVARPSEMPFFCLLENQSLVRRIAVDTDTLLGPADATGKNMARLVISVTLTPTITTWDNIGF